MGCRDGLLEVSTWMLKIRHQERAEQDMESEDPRAGRSWSSWRSWAHCGRGMGSRLDQGKRLMSTAELDMYMENKSLFVYVFVLFPGGESHVTFSFEILLGFIYALCVVLFIMTLCVTPVNLQKRALTIQIAISSNDCLDCNSFVDKYGFEQYNP